MNTIFIATNNKGKQKEFRELFATYNIEVKFPEDLGHYEEPEETAETFLENALIKARYGAKVSGLPCLSDDSGLCVPALNGAPGVYSARYAAKNNDEANKQKLIQEIKKVPEENRGAFYCCVLILIQYEHDPMPMAFQGTWHGVIQTEEVGAGGFGYDPLFYIPELNQTAAELNALDKNRLSHRGQALQKMLAFLS